MGLDLSAFLEDFRAESGEHVRTLNAQLLLLERDPDAAAPVRAMFIAAHSLKGSASMMDIADVEALAHAVEDVLARLRDGQLRLVAATADRLFRAFDLLGERVAAALPGAAPVDPPIATAIEALAATLTERLPEEPPTPPPTPPTDQPTEALPMALLVEDSATVRLLHAALLREAGFAVEVAADGEAGLVLATSRPFALIVGGIETAGLRAPELAATLHERLGAAMPPFIVTQNEDLSPDSDLPPGIVACVAVAPPGRQQLTQVAQQLVAIGKQA